MRKRLKPGEKARNFGLTDQNKNQFKLSELKGKIAILSFHPLAWTPVCAEQMKSLEKNKSIFDELNAVAIGVNIDPVPSKKAWADTLGIRNTRLLSDFWPHGKVAKSYGIFREGDGFSERANIILDRNQRVAFFKIYPLGELPDINEVIEKVGKVSKLASSAKRKNKN